MGNDELGQRMKEYEGERQVCLSSDLPVIIRCDGKAFHTFTRGLDRPWDLGLQTAMHEAATYAATKIQGCRVVYVQSDEISFLLTSPGEQDLGWFNYKLHKIVSVSASLVTGAFLAAMPEHLPSKVGAVPAFDSRAFNLPVYEINNYFWWREADAIRNSIQMLARAHFSHKQCDQKNGQQLQEMLAEKGIVWEEQLPRHKYGVCIVRRPRVEEVTFKARGKVQTTTVTRNRWEVDDNIPIFYQEPDYIGQYLEQSND